MVNFKPIIYKTLKEIEGVAVSEEYPNDWGKLPAVTYSEEDNSTYEVIDNKEAICRIIYRIDVWNNRSTSDIALKIDEAITKLGLKRTFCKDAPNPSGLKHKVIRYEGLVDINTFRVYQRN
ncbi:hypothetical protein [uncultured Clostridium sp.]|uniref:hypothetical protein n=1 Tax=uncultured Clostridium sp. TaxID=59620 RepID=UPI0027319DAF|nr:hypothetical protein [uncultured Clostridium sp.]